MEIKVPFFIWFFIWIASFIAIIIRGNKSFNINKTHINLPDNFLELNHVLRKQALDLAWQLGLSQVSSFPIKSIGNKIVSGIILLLCIFISLIDFVCSSIFLPSSSPSFAAAQEGDDIISVFLYIGFAISLLLLYSYYSRKRGIQQIQEEEEANSFFNKRLKTMVLSATLD